MKFFKDKPDKSALAEESIQTFREDVHLALKSYGTRTLFNGDGQAVRDYDEDGVFMDFIHVNKASIWMKDIDLYRFSGWTGMAMNPKWWCDLDVAEKAEAWFSQTSESVTFRERYSDPGYAKLQESIANLSGAMMALLQSFDDFDEILTAKAELATKWSKR